MHGVPLHGPPLLGDNPPSLDQDVFQSELLTDTPPILDYYVSQSDLLTMSESVPPPDAPQSQSTPLAWLHGMKEFFSLNVLF